MKFDNSSSTTNQPEVRSIYNRSQCGMEQLNLFPVSTSGEMHSELSNESHLGFEEEDMSC